MPAKTCFPVKVTKVAAIREDLDRYLCLGNRQVSHYSIEIKIRAGVGCRPVVEHHRPSSHSLLRLIFIAAETAVLLEGHTGIWRKVSE